MMAEAPPGVREEAQASWMASYRLSPATYSLDHSFPKAPSPIPILLSQVYTLWAFVITLTEFPLSVDRTPLHSCDPHHVS